MSGAEEDAASSAANAAGGGSGGGSSGPGSSGGGSGGGGARRRFDDKGLVARTSLILWHTHQNDVGAVRKLLEEDAALVNARDYDSRTPLHVAALHGWHDVAECLIANGADVNAQDRWQNTGKTGSHFEPKTIPPPLTNKADWEINPLELDFTKAVVIGKGSFGEILKANWRGTPIAVKRILPSLSDDRLVIQDFKHEVKLLIKLRHPNIVQFLGAVTETKPLMLVTEFLRGGDLHQYLKEKGALSPLTAVNFALDIARGMAYLHNEPNVVIHRDLKPRNILLVNSAANHLKVGDFGLSKIIKAQHANDVYKMTGETGSFFKHRKYDKKVDIFSFAMILYEMLEGDPPFSNYEPYEAAKYVADGHRPVFRKGHTNELKDLVELCWSGDISLRPSFLEILKRLEKLKEQFSHENHWHLFQ
ncbi:Serine/threonine-protein kinase STY17 [Dichanthelium oligosanthes]|uniref:non-specific serine/threonine protein kinase n=1 Tax=Dichanthelium oligosanthes TaxID=888268 RepID=A0A1E5W1S2_9POAL|nr:Serine/threonine-protein kinase STY17 [Dichanthelium oligosanthes]